MYKQTIHILLLTFAIMLGACSKEEPSPLIPPDAVYDIVTLVKSQKSGSVFEMRKSGDSPVITYTSTYDLASSSTHIDEGDRIIICYKRSDGEVYTSGAIVLYGFITLSNTSKELTTGNADEYHNWQIAPINMISMWRTGEYLNIEAEIYVYKAQKPEKYELVADAATVDGPYPQVYVVYSNNSDNDGSNPYSVSASFDIKSLWEKPGCSGITVNYATKSGNKSQTFDKQ